MISMSCFPICETFRGIISIRKRKIIINLASQQNKELKNKLEVYDTELKLMSKIKIISFIIFILLIGILIFMN